jgi:hypothetical protein
MNQTEHVGRLNWLVTMLALALAIVAAQSPLL